MAQSAYSSAAAPTRTPQGVEYEAFARITRRVKAAHQQGEKGFHTLVDALHQNRRLWLVLATSVADKDNPLPAQLRAQIFYLWEFTNQHTNKVLNKDADPEVLIDINTAVMRGLRMQGAQK
jgi:flagellar protein FlaF